MSVSVPNAPASVATYIYPPLDADPGALYQDAAAFMEANIPGWQSYSGELDDWILRADSSQAATLTELASDVATTIFRYFGANVLGIQPYAATTASGTATFTVQDATGYTIPALTQLTFPDSNGNQQGFETLTDTTIPSGQTTATAVAVQATVPGSASNGCSGATPQTPLTFVTAVTLNAATANGTDPEADTAYLNRLAQELTTLSATPITAAQFSTLVSTQNGVGRATTLRAFNPANWTVGATLASTNVVTVGSTANIPVGAAISGTGIPANTYVTGITSATTFTISQAATASGAENLTISGQTNQGGFVSTWAVDPNGNPLTTALSTSIQAAIQAKCLEGVTFSLEAPTVNTINITLQGACWPGTDQSTIEAAVEAAIQAYLQPNAFGQPINPIVTSGQQYGWLNDNMVRASAIEALAMNTAGMHYVSEVLINGAAGDCPLEGIVPITEPDTITVTLVNA